PLRVVATIGGVSLPSGHRPPCRWPPEGRRCAAGAHVADVPARRRATPTAEAATEAATTQTGPPPPLSRRSVQSDQGKGTGKGEFKGRSPSPLPAAPDSLPPETLPKPHPCASSCWMGTR